MHEGGEEFTSCPFGETPKGRHARAIQLGGGETVDANSRAPFPDQEATPANAHAQIASPASLGASAYTGDLLL
jgi:hypothetical protein